LIIDYLDFDAVSSIVLLAFHDLIKRDLSDASEMSKALINRQENPVCGPVRMTLEFTSQERWNIQAGAIIL
jgi:hypothetical protein